jgi:hypothetical protein
MFNYLTVKIMDKLLFFTKECSYQTLLFFYKMMRGKDNKDGLQQLLTANKTSFPVVTVPFG